MNFDDSVFGLFIIICVGGAIQALAYYINKLNKAQHDLELLRSRNDLLEAALAKVLHYFNEDDVMSYKHAFEKTNALIDARIALTGKPKQKNFS